jgi:5-methylcytosine-specific restriction endonuclease McrA
MTTYISAALRREVELRAASCCEYCRIHLSDRLFSYEIDHVISEKHGGQTSAANLCYSC